MQIEFDAYRFRVRTSGYDMRIECGLQHVASHIERRPFGPYRNQLHSRGTELVIVGLGFAVIGQTLMSRVTMTRQDGGSKHADHRTPLPVLRISDAITPHQHLQTFTLDP